MRIVKLGAFFLLMLGYCCWSYRYYDAIQVTLRGAATPKSRVVVSFLTGTDYTPYEQLEVELVPQPATPPAAGEPVAAVPFEKSVELPHSLIHRIRIALPTDPPIADVRLDSVGLAVGKQSVPYTPTPLSASAPLELSAEALKTRAYRPLLFAVQIFVAAMLTWGMSVVSRLPQIMNRETWSATARAVFIEEKRWFFWATLGTSFAVHMLWLLTNWPGATTNDSWSTLSEIQSLTLGNWHPYIYALYALSLMQLYNSIATVAIFQIVATGVTCSYIFYRCYARGVPLFWVVPFAMLFVCSIPIGLFNITFWKDIPFSIAVFIFSFVLFAVQQHREITGQRFAFSKGSLPLVVLGMILLLHSRHNGVAFYVGAPLLLVTRIPRRQFLGLLVMLVGIFVGVNKIVPAMLNIPSISGSAFHELRTVLPIMTHYNYYSKTPDEDRKVVERFVGTDWKSINAAFPRDFFSINNLPNVLRHQFQHRDDDPTNWPPGFIRRLVLENLPIFLSVRTFEFLHSIGLDCSMYDERTAFYQDPLQFQGTNLKAPGKMMYSVAIPAGPKLPKSMVDRIEAIDAWSRIYDGPLSPSVMIWNLAGYLAIFFAIMFIERGGSAISLFFLPSFGTAAAVFVAGPGESWRYFYYMYLCGIVTVPLYMEYRLSRARAALGQGLSGEQDRPPVMPAAARASVVQLKRAP